MDRIVLVGASVAGISAADPLRQRGFTGRIALLGSESICPMASSHRPSSCRRASGNRNGCGCAAAKS